MLFIEKCSLVNLSTSDIFRPKSYEKFKGLLDTIHSKSFEIVPIQGDFPILFDSIKNEFYLSNKNGITKIDASGNMVITAELLTEKQTSVFDFANFTPYVFSEKGVFDFSGDKLIYTPFSRIENFKNEINNADFKAVFEKYYDKAELVIYDTDRNIEIERACYPMYFKIKNEWILLFSQKGDYRFTNDTIGQRDFDKFPAKFNNKRLMVLKENENGIYSTKQVGEKVDEEYLKTYYGQILKERKFDYQTNNEIKIISHKKDSYYYTGGYFKFADWVCPSFLNTAYFQLTYNDENLFFKEKAVKYYSDTKCKKELYLYELPKKFRKKSKIAFLDYNLNLGSKLYPNGNIIPIIKNNGLYLIRPKKLPLTAVWQNGGFSSKLNIRISNKH